MNDADKEECMGKYIVVVQTQPTQGQEKEYNRWYDHEHLADVCAIPGVVGGHRFQALPLSLGPEGLPYLAIYEVETDDPAAVLAELRRRSAAKEMHVSPALDTASAVLWVYEKR
jgi:hypothetical protein